MASAAETSELVRQKNDHMKSIVKTANIAYEFVRTKYPIDQEYPVTFRDTVIKIINLITHRIEMDSRLIAVRPPENANTPPLPFTLAEYHVFRCESLAFMEWLIKYNIYLYSKITVVNTGAPSRNSWLYPFVRTQLAGFLNTLRKRDPKSFVEFMQGIYCLCQGLLDIISDDNELIEQINGKSSVRFVNQDRSQIFIDFGIFKELYRKLKNSQSIIGHELLNLQEVDMIFRTDKHSIINIYGGLINALIDQKAELGYLGISESDLIQLLINSILINNCAPHCITLSFVNNVIDFTKLPKDLDERKNTLNVYIEALEVLTDFSIRTENKTTCEFVEQCWQVMFKLGESLLRPTREEWLPMAKEELLSLFTNNFCTHLLNERKFPLLFEQALPIHAQNLFRLLFRKLGIDCHENAIMIKSSFVKFFLPAESISDSWLSFMIAVVIAQSRPNLNNNSLNFTYATLPSTDGMDVDEESSTLMDVDYEDSLLSQISTIQTTSTEDKTELTWHESLYKSTIESLESFLPNMTDEKIRETRNLLSLTLATEIMCQICKNNDPTFIYNLEQINCEIERICDLYLQSAAHHVCKAELLKLFVVYSRFTNYPCLQDISRASEALEKISQIVTIPWRDVLEAFLPDLLPDNIHISEEDKIHCFEALAYSLHTSDLVKKELILKQELEIESSLSQYDTFWKVLPYYFQSCFETSTCFEQYFSLLLNDPSFIIVVDKIICASNLYRRCEMESEFNPLLFDLICLHCHEQRERLPCPDFLRRPDEILTIAVKNGYYEVTANFIESYLNHYGSEKALMKKFISLLSDSNFSSQMNSVWSKIAKALDEFSIEEIQDCLSPALEQFQSSTTICYNIMNSLAHVAHHASHRVMVEILFVFIKAHLVSETYWCNKIRICLHELCEMKQTNLRQLFENYMEALLPKFLAHMLQQDVPLDSFQRILILFESKGLNTPKFLALIVTHLVRNHCDRSLRLFKNYIAGHEIRIDKEIVSDAFPLICAYMIQHEKEQRTFEQFFFSWCPQYHHDLKFSSMVSNCPLVHLSVMKYFSEYEKPTLFILDFVFRHKFNKSILNNSDNLSKAFKQDNTLMGYISNIRRLYMSSLSDIVDNINSFDSLAKFINIVGSSDIDNVYNNITALLTSLIKFAGRNGIVKNSFLLLYEAFISKISPEITDTYLVEIFKNLLLLKDIDQEKLKELYKIVFKKMDKESSKLEAAEKFFPKEESFRALRQHLQASIDDLPKELTPIETTIRQKIDYICEARDDDVKYIHLLELRNIIDKNYEELTELQDSCVPRTIFYTMSKLFSLTHNSNVRVKYGIAACLGVIGAIDPGLFDVLPCSSNQSVEPAHASFDLTSEDFKSALIARMYSLIPNANPEKIVILQYIVQELLRLFNIKNASNPILSRLDRTVQHGCLPLLSSKYSPQQHPTPAHEGETIFHRDIEKNFWLKEWTLRLIMKLDGEMREIFYTCSYAFDYDMTVAEWLLPCILFHLLKNDKYGAMANFIMKEINAAIDPTIAGCATAMTVAKSTFSDGQVSVTNYVLSEAQHLFGRLLFRICESFEEWSQKLHNDSSQIRLFLDGIPKERLAVLAYGCGAHARSVKYCEEYLKSDIFKARLSNSSPIQRCGDEEYELLQKNYVALSDTDSVIGMATLRPKNSSASDEVMLHEAKGNLQDALSCCERAIKLERNDLGLAKKFVRTLMALDQYSTATYYLRGLVEEKPAWRKSMFSYQVKAAWRLSQWDDLEILLTEKALIPEKLNMNVGIGKALFHLNNVVKKQEEGNEQIALIDVREELEAIINTIRLNEMVRIASAVHEKGGYSRAYQQFVNLQMLTDIDSIVPYARKESSNSAITFGSSVHNRWMLRNNLVQKSLRTLEPILSLQRVLYCLNNDSEEERRVKLTESWLESAKLSRKENNFQRAYNCILEINHTLSDSVINSNYELLSKLIIEKAKLSWMKGDQDSREKAVAELTYGTEKYFFKKSNQERKIETTDEEARPYLAKMLLLAAKYKDQCRSASSDTILDCYKEVLKLDPNWEEAHFTLAQYYDKLGRAIQENIRSTNSSMNTLEEVNEAISKVIDYVTMLKEASTYFKQSLLVGDRHCHEAVPRLLSIYFEIGLYCSTAKQEGSIGDIVSNNRRCHDEIGNHFPAIEKNVKDVFAVKPGIFMSVFSQMVSRLLHPYSRVQDLLVSLIAKLIQNYPQQAMWLLIGPTKNTSNEAHNRKCKDCIAKAFPGNYSAKASQKQPTKLNNKNIFPHLISILSAALVEVAEIEPQKGIAQSMVVLNEKSKLMNILTKFSNLIMLPLKSQMRVPINGPLIQDTLIKICSVDASVKIFNSLARPKQIVFNGNDGNKYRMLCKPKDDTRVDQRFMEFAEEVNRLLKRSQEARKRHLNIRTYIVIPLSNTCGLIEWLDGLTDLRATVSKAYETYSHISAKEMMMLRGIFPKKDPERRSLSFEQRLWTLYHQEIMPRVTPPRLSNWFFDRFPDPTEWYLARLNFSRSCAVMSMVGYVMGLGDRHLENILLDTNTGEVVHVDFNCLFNKGELLLVPEIVPFRLTHNLIDAMGTTGYEGVFRKTCEVTMQIMRDNCDSLVSILEPFLYDPLLEWTNVKSSSAANEATQTAFRPSATTENKNLSALRQLLKIRNRLTGLVEDTPNPLLKEKRTKASKIPLSIAGQVQHLIEQVTSPENLCRMFVGWAYYL